MGDRCRGHCCRKFFLPYSPEELKVRRNYVPGDEQVPDMVIPLHPCDIGYKDVNDNEIESVPVLGWYYTCKNLDLVTNNCKIYATRPPVCRDYPYGRACQYNSCEWDKGKCNEEV